MTKKLSDYLNLGAIPKISNEIADATRGQSRFYGYAFREACMDYHASGHQWNRQQLRSFFFNGLFRHYLMTGCHQDNATQSYGYSYINLYLTEQENFASQQIYRGKGTPIQRQKVKEEFDVHVEYPEFAPFSDALIKLVRPFVGQKELIYDWFPMIRFKLFKEWQINIINQVFDKIYAVELLQALGAEFQLLKVEMECLNSLLGTLNQFYQTPIIQANKEFLYSLLKEKNSQIDIVQRTIVAWVKNFYCQALSFIKDCWRCEEGQEIDITEFNLKLPRFIINPDELLTLLNGPTDRLYFLSYSDERLQTKYIMPIDEIESGSQRLLGVLHSALYKYVQWLNHKQPLHEAPEGNKPCLLIEESGDAAAYGFNAILNLLAQFYHDGESNKACYGAHSFLSFLMNALKTDEDLTTAVVLMKQARGPHQLFNLTLTVY